MTPVSFFARLPRFSPFFVKSRTGATALPLPAAPAEARCLPVVERLDGPPARIWRVHDGGPQGHTHGDAKGGGEKKADTGKDAGAKPANRGPTLPAGNVELTFLGHSSFLIRTHENAAAITDYNGYNRAPFAPDIVTMNRAHSSHFTLAVEPGVKHILKGWMENGKIPVHDVSVRDLRVTNVQTNIRENLTDAGGLAGNSIFIFESAGLCIAHLGHLHHDLLKDHAGRVGSVDIMLAPIDNGYTMSHETLMKVIATLRPQVVIPMHYGYAAHNLEAFLALMTARKFATRRAEGSTARFSKVGLPGQQTVVVLQAGGSSTINAGAPPHPALLSLTKGSKGRGFNDCNAI